jgi:hypothetical protein
VDIFDFNWKPLHVEKQDNSALIYAAQRTGVAKGAVQQPRKGFLLHDGVSDPNSVPIHDHHTVLLLCLGGNYLAIMVRTRSAALRWKIG